MGLGSGVPTPSVASPLPKSIWGLDYNFTNYNFSERPISKRPIIISAKDLSMGLGSGDFLFRRRAPSCFLCCSHFMLLLLFMLFVSSASAKCPCSAALQRGPGSSLTSKQKKMTLTRYVTIYIYI